MHLKHLCLATAITATGLSSPTITSQDLSLTIAGSTWGILDGDGRTFSSTLQEGSLAGQANWTVTSPAQGAWLPLDLYSWATGQVDHTVTPDRLATSGSLRAESWTNVGYPYASLYAFSAVTFDISFELENDTPFSFLLEHRVVHGGGGLRSPYAELVPAALSGPSGSVFSSIGLWSSPGVFRFSVSGVLPSGSYHLAYSPMTSVAGDPLGEFGYYDFTMALDFLQASALREVESVPDGGSMALLLLFALAVLRRR